MSCDESSISFDEFWWVLLSFDEIWWNASFWCRDVINNVFLGSGTVDICLCWYCRHNLFFLGGVLDNNVCGWWILLSFGIIVMIFYEVWWVVDEFWLVLMIFWVHLLLSFEFIVMNVDEFWYVLMSSDESWNNLMSVQSIVMSFDEFCWVLLDFDEF